MKRWTVSLWTWVSVIGLAAIVALWLRSYVMEDRLLWSRKWEWQDSNGAEWTTWRYCESNSGRGGLRIKAGVEEFNFHTWEIGGNGLDLFSHDSPRYPWLPDEGTGWRGFVNRLGFHARYRSKRQETGRTRDLGITLPIWSVGALTSLAPVVRTCAWLARRRRHGKCMCAMCGYDLRASTGRCPECGTTIMHPDDAPYGVRP